MRPRPEERGQPGSACARGRDKGVVVGHGARRVASAPQRRMATFFAGENRQITVIVIVIDTGHAFAAPTAKPFERYLRVNAFPEAAARRGDGGGVMERDVAPPFP